MKMFRLTFATALLAAILAGCIVQADTFSNQNPFNAPDTLQSSGGDGSVEEASNDSDPHTPTPPTPTSVPPTPTSVPPAPTPTPPIPECEIDNTGGEIDNTGEECDHIDQARW